MSAAVMRRSPPSDATSSAGFKSFWKKGSKDEQEKAATFVPQDPSGKDKASRVRRVLGSSSPSSDGKGEKGTQSEAQKRRQQVYQAQKYDDLFFKRKRNPLTTHRRHRNRKAEYITSLEEEIARLRHLDSETNSEKNNLANQNQAMRDLLSSQSLDTQLGAIDLSSHSSSLENLSGSLNLRYDEQVESNRWFVDFMNPGDMQWTSSETSEHESREQSAPTPVAGDSWAALDFILALEHPCRDHVHHPLINPDAWKPESGEAHGHGMTTTAAVFAGALQNPMMAGESSRSQDRWLLPHSEIDKLVELSGKLATDDTDITPAQAYSAVREAVPNDAFLRPVLESLKQPLGRLVHCAHFGSLLSTTLFWQHFDGIVQSLQFTRPELCGTQG